MKNRFFLRYWPVTIVLVTIFLSNLLVITFVTVKAFSPDTTNSHQETPFASPIPQDRVVIPNTGQEAGSIFASIVSSWFLWVALGMVLLFFLLLLMARSGGKNHRRKLE